MRDILVNNQNRHVVKFVVFSVKAHTLNIYQNDFRKKTLTLNNCKDRHDNCLIQETIFRSFHKSYITFLEMYHKPGLKVFKY